MKKGLTIFVLLFTFIAITISAQENSYVWKNILTEKVYSSEVDDNFKLYIKLPDNYYDTTKTYPLIVVLDGDNLFPIATGVTQYLEYGEHIPETILVGIGYGTLDWFNGNNRSRDYTAFATEGRPYEGGGLKFLKFLKNELIPNLKNNYRIEENNLSLMGHSLGGQAVVNTFVNEPDLFNKYIASSPFIYRWQKHYFDLIEKNSNRIKNSSSKIFISRGENELTEEYKIPISKLVENINAVSNSKVIFKTFDEGEHFIVPPISLTKGLVELFK